MKNFVQTGDTVSLLAPYAVTSGQGFLIGSIFAVASSDAANGAPVEGVTEGIFNLVALNTDTATVGQKAYWDNTAKNITSVLTANQLVGVFYAVKTNPSLIATVLLDGAIR